MAGVTNMVQQLKQVCAHGRVVVENCRSRHCQARATLMERLEQQETTNQTLREQIARLESRPNDELKALQEVRLQRSHLQMSQALILLADLVRLCRGTGRAEGSARL